MLKAIAFKRQLLIGVMLLFVAVFVAPGRGLANLDDNLVGYWSFDDRTATDNSGHGVTTGRSTARQTGLLVMVAGHFS